MQALVNLFGKVEKFLFPIVAGINEYLSSYILIFLLIGVGLWYTIKTRFVQVRCFGEGMRKVFGNISLKGEKQEKGMTSFQALATAIAAQVGTGNIIGASGAILIGGPGAIFWMWVIAFFGMATIYAEATLAIKTRSTSQKGNIKGGPVYYITTAFKGGFGKFLAGFFAVATILALGFMGCMVQSNSIGSTMSTAFGIPSWAVGLVLVVLCGIIFLGGVKRLASVTEKIVPVMACIFLLGGLVVLAIRIKYIPATIGMIFKYAFNAKAILSGTIIEAIVLAVSQGAKRGLFSNEAGMGSTPHAHAQANVKDPHEQGVAAMIGVFIDTFIVLTMTALVVISTLYAGNGILSKGGDKVTYINSKHEIVNVVDMKEYNEKVEASKTKDGENIFASSIKKDNYDGFKDAKSVVIDNEGKITEQVSKTNMAQWSFSGIMGTKFGAIFVAICLFFFAFSTILGWNLFGKINANYLFGNKKPELCTAIYSIIALVFIFIGTLVSNELVWELTDMFNNLMVIPNAIALFALTAMVVSSTKKRDGSPLKK